MSQENTLSVPDIAKELDTGKTTIKFLLKRFQQWLPFELIDGQPLYPDTAIKKIILIQEGIDAGMLLSDIEKKINAISNSDPSKIESSDLLDSFASSSKNGDIRLSKDGLIILKSLINDIGVQQKRVAKAHEKRADAEEKKAIAIGKRAEAEEKKAEAMNNIANALQEMNKLRVSDLETMQIVHEAANVIAIDEDSNFQENNNNLSSELEKTTTDDLSLLIQEEQKPESTDGDSPQLDDLSLLLDEKEEPENAELDDLSALIDTSPDVDQPESNMDNIDDLSALIDDKPSASTDIEQLDDLSLLLDAQSKKTDKPKEQNRQKTTDKVAELDDLSKLIDTPSEQEKQGVDMDDLSLLINESSGIEQEHGEELDDLESLIESESPKTDDLSKLSHDAPEPVNDYPEIKIDISPEQDLGKYKASIMKIIIKLKTDGIDVKETTNRLNQNKIKTLSGKPEWTQKAISQIYKFIESAQ